MTIALRNACLWPKAAHARFTPDNDGESGFPHKVMLLYSRKQTFAVH
jgi:hypothetical protein